jgi:hypothetical protein
MQWYSKGLLVCATCSVYGLWLIAMSANGRVVRWLRGFGDVRTAQTVIGAFMQLPLPAYLYLGFRTGMLG